MRTVHKTAAIVAALGIAFGVTACGTDTDSTPVAKSTPKAMATTTSPAPTPTATTAPMTVDESLKMDLKYMATAQEIWLTDTNPQASGFAVTATKPGGTVKLSKKNVFHAAVGNVIAVEVSKAGYCISVYNTSATMATSATESFVYKSDQGGLQAAVGTCPQAGTLSGVDASLKMDLKNMATLQETWITNNVTSSGVVVTATKPGGIATVETPGDFPASPGNVIAVKVGNGDYCISGYNKVATTATSVTKSLVYKSDKGGIQAGVGAC